MSIDKECSNCIYSDIWANSSKAECKRFPEVIDIMDRIYYECGEHELDYEEVNRILRKQDEKMYEKCKALKREIKRLGGNPRKLGKD